MKLLKPSEVKDTQQVELTRKILRIQETEDLAQKTNIRLANAQADFNRVLAENLKKWEVLEDEHARRKKEMLAELNELENKKEGIDELQELLEERLTEVGEREENVKLKEQKLKVWEETIKDLFPPI